MSNVKEYLSETLGLIDERYTEEALLVLDTNYLKQKNNRKKLLALVVTMIAVRGISKYVSSNELHLHKTHKGV